MNALPGGVTDKFKKPVPFEEWETFFSCYPDVLINCVIRAASYKSKKFVQVVPTAITEINLDDNTDNENDLEFFAFH